MCQGCLLLLLLLLLGGLVIVFDMVGLLQRSLLRECGKIDLPGSLNIINKDCGGITLELQRCNDRLDNRETSVGGYVKIRLL